jgi:hypothetical protein
MTKQTTPKPTTTSQSITNDTIYYVMAAVFALLTTALPALMGQPRFLPIIQTLSLTTFVTIALRHRNVRGALALMAIWLPIQFILLTLLTTLLPTQVEHAFTDGFAYRASITTWFFGGAPHPDGFALGWTVRIVEIVAIVIGSLATAGLLGIWFLVRLVNQAAYGTGILLATIDSSLYTLLVIPYWTLLRAAAYAGLIVICALPLLTYQWSPTYYWRQHRRLIVTSLVLLLLALLFELFLPGLLARTPLN